MKNIKEKKEYPKNLLSQVFVNGLPTELPDDVALVLEYIIQKTLTEREGRVLDMRYKRYMTMAAIGEEYGLRAERIRQIEAKAVRKLRHPSRSRYILNSLGEQIADKERREKLEKEIVKLEKLARAEKQPKKKFEMVQEIKKKQFELRRIINGN